MFIRPYYKSEEITEEDAIKFYPDDYDKILCKKGVSNLFSQYLNHWVILKKVWKFVINSDVFYFCDARLKGIIKTKSWHGGILFENEEHALGRGKVYIEWERKPKNPLDVVSVKSYDTKKNKRCEGYIEFNSASMGGWLEQVAYPTGMWQFFVDDKLKYKVDLIRNFFQIYGWLAMSEVEEYNNNQLVDLNIFHYGESVKECRYYLDELNNVEHMQICRKCHYKNSKLDLEEFEKCPYQLELLMKIE